MALIVGVSKYENTNAKAMYADNDALVFKDYAIEKLGIRPEKMFLTDKKGIPGVVFGSEYLGARKILTIKSEFGDFKVRVSNQVNAQIGSNVKINFEPKSAIVFDGTTDKAIESRYIKLN